MSPGNRVIRDKLSIYVRARRFDRYLPDADSPAREKHARLIAVGITVEYLKRSLCCAAHYDRMLVFRGVQGMLFRAILQIIVTF